MGVLTNEQAADIIKRATELLTDPVMNKGASGGEILTLLGTVMGAVVSTIVVAESGSAHANPDTNALFAALAHHGKLVSDDMLKGFAEFEVEMSGGIH